MSKKKYIVLPTIRSFEIFDYPMFNQDWKYTVRTGLNLVLGVYEIGKTTTANLIIYALVGTHKGLHEERNPEYFLNRLDNQEEFLKDGQRQPRIQLEVVIGDHSLNFSRSLTENEILKLVIDKKEIDFHDELTDQYEEILKEFTGLGSMDDLAFLLSRLLVREEEGNYLLWDEESQSRIIRLLLNTQGFAEEYRELEDKLQDADSAYKREKDFMGRYENRKKELLADREKSLSADKGFVKKEDLTKLVERFTSDRRLAIAEKDRWLLKSAQVQAEIVKLEKESSSIRSSYEFNAEEYKVLETRFYKSSFDDPKTELVFTKIDQRHICIVCNSNVSNKKAGEVIRKVRTHHECPVCESPLKNTDEEVGAMNARDLKRMESLDQLIKQGKKEIDKRENSLESLLKEQAHINQELAENEQKIRDATVNLALHQNKLNELLKHSETPVTSFDFTILEIEKEIEAYRQKTEPLLKKYKAMVQKMDEKNEELNSSIDKFNARLVEIFSSLSQSYFGDTCGLILHGRKPRGFELQVKYFIPILHGKERYFQGRVSKSQAIFLEYLFRLSLLQLYSEIAGIKPFLFLETSEGSFDVSNTELMAETLQKSGRMGFALIIITNLSKADFIQELLPDVQERKKRTFNLLTYAHKSIQSKRNIGALNKALKRLQLN